MGDWLCEQLQIRLDNWCPQLFGYHLLKLGALSGELSTLSCTIRHQVTLTDGGGIAGLYADVNALPFQESCIDACVLAHGLDFTSDPHQLLREVERALTSDGCLIVSGFNPFSWLGMGKYLPFRRNKLPWSGRLFTPTRVRDWLHLLGFEVLQDDRFGFGFLSGGRLAPSWLEKLGQDYFPLCCSVYFIVAKKRTTPFTPIKETWRVRRPILTSGAVANREINTLERRAER